MTTDVLNVADGDGGGTDALRAVPPACMTDRRCLAGLAALEGKGCGYVTPQPGRAARTSAVTSTSLDALGHTALARAVRRAGFGTQPTRRGTEIKPSDNCGG